MWFNCLLGQPMSLTLHRRWCEAVGFELSLPFRRTPTVNIAQYLYLPRGQTVLLVGKTPSPSPFFSWCGDGEILSLRTTYFECNMTVAMCSSLKSKYSWKIIFKSLNPLHILFLVASLTAEKTGSAGVKMVPRVREG